MEQFDYEVVSTGDLYAKIYLHDTAATVSHNKPHWHNSLEFDCPLIGNIDALVNGNHFTASPGNFIFINADVVHSTRMLDCSYLNGITILIPFDFVKGYLPDKKSYTFDLTDRSQGRDLLFQDILRIHTIYSTKETAYKAQINSLILDMISILIKYCSKQDDSSTVATEKNAKALLEYICNNYSQPITLETISTHFGFSRTYFSRYFKKMSGMNFYDYLKSIRLKHALYQLCATEDSILDIALESGFPNVKAFNAATKEYYNMTPALYRKSNTPAHRPTLHDK